MQVYELAVKRKPSRLSKYKQAAAFAAAVFVTTVYPVAAQAEGIDTIGAGLTSEVTASKAIILTLFGIGATVLALFAGYRYMKRGANSA